jgi:hypothetical protein
MNLNSRARQDALQQPGLAIGHVSASGGTVAARSAIARIAEADPALHRPLDRAIGIVDQAAKATSRLRSARAPADRPCCRDRRV